MAKRITRKQMKHDEFVEATFDFAHWLEQHWGKVLSGVGVGVLITLAVIAWMAWSKKNADRLSQELARNIDRFEQAEVAGFSDAAGLSEILTSFDEIASEGGGGTGQVARFYRGATLFHMDRLDEARDELEQVVSVSDASATVGVTARLFLARVEVSAGQTDEAVALLNRLAEDPTAVIPPARVLLEMGRIQQQAGREDEARVLWQRIVDEHPQSLAAGEAGTLLR